ncbi:MAG: hypothetical protein C4325_03140 [Blastocatellia bacterium]
MHFTANPTAAMPALKSPVPDCLCPGTGGAQGVSNRRESQSAEVWPRAKMIKSEPLEQFWRLSRFANFDF